MGVLFSSSGTAVSSSPSVLAAATAAPSSVVVPMLPSPGPASPGPVSPPLPPPPAVSPASAFPLSPPVLPSPTTLLAAVVVGKMHSPESAANAGGLQPHVPICVRLSSIKIKSREPSHFGCEKHSECRWAVWFMYVLAPHSLHTPFSFGLATSALPAPHTI